MHPIIKRSCVACGRAYWVWFWEQPTKRLHICCKKCRTALQKGYDLGLRASREVRVASKRPALLGRVVCRH